VLVAPESRVSAAQATTADNNYRQIQLSPATRARRSDLWPQRVAAKNLSNPRRRGRARADFRPQTLRPWDADERNGTNLTLTANSRRPHLPLPQPQRLALQRNQ